MTNPDVARKTPNQAIKPEPAVNFGRFDAAMKVERESINNYNHKEKEKNEYLQKAKGSYQ